MDGAASGWTTDPRTRGRLPGMVGGLLYHSC
jgi:hypothetical protein